MMADEAATTGAKFGDRERVVRITGIRRRAYVEFDFTVGDKELTVELIMPYSAFREFCTDNGVRILPISPEIGHEMEQLKWRFGDRTELGR